MQSDHKPLWRDGARLVVRLGSFPTKQAPGGSVMVAGRIWFEGNPWPEGHALAEFSFAACLHEHGVGLLLHAETVPYHEEYPDLDDDSEDGAELDDWQAISVWRNYGSATISNSKWGIDDEHLPDFRIVGDANAVALSPERRYLIDSWIPSPTDEYEVESDFFHAYILGHDTTRGHNIAMKRRGETWDIEWTGLIAHVYVGETEFRHPFRIAVEGATFDGYLIQNKRPHPPYIKPSGSIFPRGGRTPPEPAQRFERATALAERYLGGTEALQFQCGRGFEPDWLRPTPQRG